MSAVRSVVAVLVGFVAVAVLSIGTDAICHATGVFPPIPERMSDAWFVLPAVYRAAYTVVGGAITTRLAPRAPFAHAGVLAVLGTLGGLAGLAGSWSQLPAIGPVWYAVSIPVSAFPCIFAGAWAVAPRA